MKNEGDAISLVDPKNNSTIASISPVDVYDSFPIVSQKHSSLYNSIDFELLDHDKYLLTISIDEDFLNNKDTIYPVIIDPTIVFDSDPIYDAPVFSGYPSSNFNSNTYNVVGYHGTTYGEGVSYIKIDNINNYKYINPSKITSVFFHVYEGSGKSSSATVNVYDVLSSWKNSTITYNKQPNLASNAYSSLTISSSKWYDFNITELFQEWLKNALNDGGKSQDYGFALKMSSTGVSSRHFCSANHGTYPPSIVINYSEDISIENDVYYLISESSRLYLTANGNTFNQTVCGYSREQHWSFRSANGYYSISPSSSDFKSYLNSKSENLSNVTDLLISAQTGISRSFRVIRNQDGTYRLLSRCGNYNYAVTAISNNKIQLAEYTGANNQRWNLYSANKQLETSLIFLYYYANEYNSQKANLLLCNYIRSNFYNSDSWDIVADTVDNNFINYVNSQFPELNTLRTKRQYSYSGSSECVDFTHLCATLNALLFESTDAKARLVGETVVNDLSGWAGDFQTLVVDTVSHTFNSNDYTTFYNKFREIIGSSHFSFSYPDIFADLDALYIYNNYANSTSFSNSIIMYYTEGKYSNRYIHFINGRSRNELYNDVYVYGKNKWKNIKQWPIYKSANCTITTTQAKAASDAFTDFILSKIS